MNTLGGRLAVALLCLSLLAGGAAVTTSVTDVADGPVVTVDAATQSDTENETVRHQNPDEQQDDGDANAVRRWLESELSRQLGDSAVQLSEGDYETAREILGDDYQDRYAQYVEVEGEIDEESATDSDETGAGDGDGGAGEGGEGDQTADGLPATSTNDSFQEIAAEQEQLADLLEEFEETQADYYDAVQANDDERAHDLARDIEELAGQIEGRSENITVHFETLEEDTGADFTESKESIDRTNSDVQETREVITVEQFEPTVLTIEPDHDHERDETAISFLEPLEATGTVQTENGTPVASQNITLEIGAEGAPFQRPETRTVRTDETGSFALQYRPTTIPLSTTDLSIAYEPPRGSGYIGAETNVSVTVEQDEPTLSDLSSAETTAAYESVPVAGELSVDGVPVDNVTVDVGLGDEPIGNATVSNGTLDGTATVPPTVPDGDHELTVQFAGADRALANATASTEITVLESESDLAVTAEQFDDEHVSVSGTLTTAAGEEIGGEPIELAVDDESVGTVSTDENGSFETVVALPVDPAEIEGESVELTASYEGDGTSIAPTATSAAATIAGAESTLLSSQLLVGGVLVVALAGSLASLLWYRRRESDDARSVDRSEYTPTETPSGSEPKPDPEPVEPLLSQAATALSEDRPEEAVRLGYAAVRREFQSRIEGSRSLTHWEFYRQYRGQESETDSLRSLTELYERASYGVDRVSDTDAATVLESARQLCEFDERSAQRRNQDRDPNQEFPADD
ncbi:hypothetical protein OB955_19520 [Halobacteria archaeon AArc-m2/3/4]|uniref:DUF4129 domain-containing protein n=1 Tax=Natronoglomus mannanivorans TaxID=2979990 RepID=A0ABT2QIZ9_9EURY|nr:hypothetical protein [Halobacteria archaeon AArc-m2/3/4]